MLIFELLIILAIVAIAVYYSKKNRTPEKIKIKYGLKEKKILHVCTIVSFGMVIGFALFISFDDKLDLSNILMVLLYLLTLFGGLSFLPFLIIYIDAALYLREMKKYGYTIPDNRKDFGGYLYNVPRIDNKDNTSDINGREMYPLVMSVISILFTLVISVITLKFYFDWRFMGDEMLSLVIFASALVWLIIAAIFFFQSDNNKFKDRVDIYNQKKNRMALADSISLILIMSIAVVIYVSTIFSMKLYIYKSKRATDKDYLVEYTRYAQGIYDDHFNEKEWEEVFGELEAGYDILNSEDSLKDFNEELLQRSECNSMQDIDDALLIKDAHFVLTLSDGVVSGEYRNDHDYLMDIY